jgi:hypothetical protein
MDISDATMITAPEPRETGPLNSIHGHFQSHSPFATLLHYDHLNMITRAHWSLLALVTAAAIWLVFLRAAPTPASSNEPSSAPGKHAFRQRLIAVGDLHGGGCFDIHARATPR